MSEPFISQITMFGFDFAPRTWAKCDGQNLPIANNPSLFSLLGIAYGGDGRTTFGLPNLQGRAPVHMGNGYRIGDKGGSETVRLTVENLPRHTHQMQANSQPAETNEPSNQVLAMEPSGKNIYGPATNLVEMGNALMATGGGEAHFNMQPSQVINFCIALTGLFPPRN
ncbi:phage tail protein [Endozoicomonas sp. SM1973]|uniref:Phage tail protein n=1 Tax=Spartinivicinus marinus TaxID=2994442 RepID=A0A853I2J1_9GAMM|nr:tail fiber protein [Spartinivicinus marinus]MCX4029331.1 tail fiber protein [Spartinivicinus marinus]NYZ68170.1 phage tail protein [Spartinivicinus marinus]